MATFTMVNIDLSQLGHCPNSKSVKADKGNRVNMRLRWDKADLMLYYDTTRIQFDSVTFGNDANYDMVLTALYTAARLCVPVTVKHYWDDELNDLKRRSLEANKLWIYCGRPRSGTVYHERRLAKYNYKKAIRNKQRESDACISNELNDCLLNRDTDTFWKTWNSKFNSKRCLPQCIDGMLDNSDIAINLLPVLKQLANLTQLLSTLN